MRIAMTGNSSRLSDCTVDICNLDGFKYPDYWKDDERMNAIFSPFRSRNLNAENYEAKLTFWKNLIRDYCLYMGEGYFTKHELEVAFKRGQSVPTCLSTVIMEMQKAKMICSRCQYESQVNGEDWFNWTVNLFVRQPFNWTRSLLTTTMQRGNKEDEAMDTIEFVYLNVMDDFCKRLHNILQKSSFVGTLVSFQKLKDASAEFLHLTDGCLQVCLAKLHSDNKVGIHYQDKSNPPCIDIIKIPDGKDSTTIITEGDLAHYKLESMQHDLMNQLQVIELEIEENRKQISLYLKNEKRNLAKIYLRKSHLLKKNHENRCSALCNIDAMLAAMDEAKHTGTMLELHKDSSKAIQDATNALNIQFDKSQQCIFAIQDNIERLTDIQDAVSVNLNLNDSIDEQQLEEELNEIINAEKSKLNDSFTKLPSASKNDDDIVVKLKDIHIKDVPIANGQATAESNSSHKKSTNSKENDSAVLN